MPGNAGGGKQRSSDEDFEESWKGYPCLNLFECFLPFFLPLFSSVSRFSCWLRKETDRVENKTPDTYFTPKLFTNGEQSVRGERRRHAFELSLYEVAL